MLAHHEAFMLVQAGGSIGLSGFAALIGARWFSLTRRIHRPDPSPVTANAPTSGES